MKSAFAIVCILAALTTAYSRDVKTDDFTSSDFSVPPDFGQGLECPPFKLVANTSKYQLREYDAGKLVSTTWTMDVGESTGFKSFWQIASIGMKTVAGVLRLEEYFAGDNADNKSVSKMTPMITFMEFSRAEMNATTAFFLPEQFRGNPPTPSNTDVKLGDAKLTVYVKAASGRYHLMTEFEAFRKELIQDRIFVEDGAFVWAEYDDPSGDAHNHEIWIIAPDNNYGPSSSSKITKIINKALNSALAAAREHAPKRPSWW